MPPIPMIPNAWVTQAGLLPIRSGPVRFAVGNPNHLTSNSWRIWTTKNGDCYIKCRDNFRETKVSLHTGGRWRMGFTSEAVTSGAVTLEDDANRAWEVWDEPSATLPNGAIVAFRLLFPTSELAVTPEMRVSKEWKDVIYIEAATAPDKMTILTLFVTVGDVEPVAATEPSFRLASLEIANGRRVQVVAHGAPLANIPNVIEKAVAGSRDIAASKNIALPETAYGYFLGRMDDGSRWLVGARVPGQPGL